MIVSILVLMAISSLLETSEQAKKQDALSSEEAMVYCLRMSNEK